MRFPVEYYESQITSQYQQSQKFLAWLRVCLGIFDDIAECADSFLGYFDLDTATGAQLDTLGVIVGESRIVPFQPANGVSPVLDDDTFRLLLKAKIAQNHWDGKINSLQAIWQSLFPGGRIQILDHQDMSATVVMMGSISSIVQDLITHGMIVPRPQAVLYNYVFGVQPLFGFDRNDAYVAGFDTGHWV